MAFREVTEKGDTSVEGKGDVCEEAELVDEFEVDTNFGYDFEVR